MPKLFVAYGFSVTKVCIVPLGLNRTTAGAKFTLRIEHWISIRRMSYHRCLVMYIDEATPILTSLLAQPFARYLFSLSSLVCISGYLSPCQFYAKAHICFSFIRTTAHLVTIRVLGVISLRGIHIILPHHTMWSVSLHNNKLLLPHLMHACPPSTILDHPHIWYSAVVRVLPLTVISSVPVRVVRSLV